MTMCVEGEKKLKNVTYNDVKFIGWRLSFNFRLKKVQKDDIILNLLPLEIQDKGMVSLRNVKTILSAMPFNITDPKELSLLSEYMIDDGDSEEKITEESE